MGALQRAWRCVIRKPVKSCLLFLAILAVSLLMLAGMASKSAGIHAQDRTRQAIGAGLRLDVNETNRSQRIRALSKQIGDGVEGSLGGVHQQKVQVGGLPQWLVWTDNSFETLQFADVQAIAAVPGIAAYNLTTAVTAVNPVNFKRIEDASVDQSGDKKGVSLIGNLDMAFDTNVYSGNVTITQGRMVTSADADVCVISEQLAALNGLTIGEALQFNSYKDPAHSERYEAEIIGIYRTAQSMSAYMPGDTYRSENVIFTDLRFPEKPQGAMDSPLFEHAYFQIGNVDNYEAVKQAVQALNLDWARYDLIDKNGNLTAMASNFNNLGQISAGIVWVAVAAGFVLLFLIFTFWIKNRKKEIGVLLSIGTPKAGILWQLFAEAIIVVLLAFSVSLIVAKPICAAAASYLTDQQSTQAALSQQADAGKIATTVQSSAQEITGVEVALSPRMALQCGAGITLLLAASVSVAGISILRKKPSEILSELS